MFWLEWNLLSVILNDSRQTDDPLSILSDKRKKQKGWVVDFFMTTTSTDIDFGILFKDLGKQTFDVPNDSWGKLENLLKTSYRTWPFQEHWFMFHWFKNRDLL